ncbi:hypothetical protein CCR82_17000 [Halochromatium salexigens]|uniref:Uncharacterized protein n=1 Tax=Halochromatium salexigens TaxID=49447 RepID=A0AAJ0UJ27_HALSE|nr:hypothetical protein [Halochromatium salexigens]
MTLEVTVRLSGSLMEMEEVILEATNALECCATEEALGRFDTDGSPIRLGETKLTAPVAAIRRSTRAPMAMCSSSATSTRPRAVGAFTVHWNIRHGSSVAPRHGLPASSATNMPSSMYARCSEI